MGWPVTLIRTWVQADFLPWNFAKNWSDFFGEVASLVAEVRGARDTVLTVYNAILAQVYPIAQLTAPTNLTQTAHNNRLLLMTEGAAVALLSANISNGFSCVLENRRSVAATISVSGIELRNIRGHTKVAANGCAQLYVYPDGSLLCARLVGDTEA